MRGTILEQRRGVMDKDGEVIKTAYDAGMSVGRLARAYRVSGGTMWRFLHDKGWLVPGRAALVETQCPQCGKLIKPDVAHGFRVYPCRDCGYAPGREKGAST